MSRDVESFLKQVPYEITNAWEQKGGGSWIFRIPALKPILLSNFRQKHIPDEYMCASEEQRWALLQEAYGLRWVHWREKGAERLCVYNKGSGG